MNNQLRIIYPYLDDHQTWVFDDEDAGLVREPFVNGIPEMIYHFTEKAGIKAAGQGFALLFSHMPFPGMQAQLTFDGAEFGGDWYRCEEFRGWLCPALLKYFPEAPRAIFIQCKPLPERSPHVE